MVLAIRWPTEDFTEYDEITVLQDVFPVVFACLFQDKRLLETKMKWLTVEFHSVSRITIEDGIIDWGLHDRQPFFLSKP
jgi:hypothetical protein